MSLKAKRNKSMKKIRLFTFVFFIMFGKILYSQNIYSEANFLSKVPYSKIDDAIKNYEKSSAKLLIDEINTIVLNDLKILNKENLDLSIQSNKEIVLRLYFDTKTDIKTIYSSFDRFQKNGVVILPDEINFLTLDEVDKLKKLRNFLLSPADNNYPFNIDINDNIQKFLKTILDKLSKGLSNADNIRKVFGMDDDKLFRKGIEELAEINSNLQSSLDGIKTQINDKEIEKISVKTDAGIPKGNIYDIVGTIGFESLVNEFSTEFFTKFEDKIAVPPLPDLFAKTYYSIGYKRTLSELLKDNITIYSLQNNFKEDLRDLPESLFKLIADWPSKKTYYETKGFNVQKLDDLINSVTGTGKSPGSSESYNYFIIFYSMYKKLGDGSHPVDLLSDIHDILNISIRDKNLNSQISIMYNILQFSQKAFSEFSHTESESNWIKRFNFENPTKGEEFFYYFFIEKIINNGIVKLGSSVILEKIKKDFYLNKDIFKDKITKISSSLRNLQLIIKKNSNDKMQYVDYMSKSFELFENIVSFSNYLNIDLKMNFYSNNIDIIKLKSIESKSTNIFKSVIKEDYKDILLNISILFSELIKDNKGDNSLLTILNNSFILSNQIIELSQAKDRDEMKKAIENLIAPPLTIKQKRKSEFDLSITASPGLFFGYTKISNFKLLPENRTYGLTMPIGFDVSTKLNKGSLSLFGSVLDLGAIFKFRANGNTEPLEEKSISFNDVFSPGLFIKYGFDASPVSIAIGCQKTPLLKTITSDQGFVTGANDLIWTFSLNWDIVLFNLLHCDN